MKYVLDTNIIVDHLRGKARISPAWLKSGACISVITFAELVTGAYRSEQTEKNLQKIQTLIEECELSIQQINIERAYEYGIRKAQLAHEGQPIEDFDLLIAATAIDLEATLITRDLKHFHRIPGLIVEEIR